MPDLDPSAAPTPVPPRVRRGRRGLPWYLFVLPAIAVAGVLGVAWISGVTDACGGPVPGCGSIRNTGEHPVTVRALTPADGNQAMTYQVPPDDRALLLGAVNEVWVDAGQCLLADGGPFWNVPTIIDRTGDETGAWHPVDDWGARVHLHDGPCPEGD
ncbi:hypothetical protein ACFUTX_00075 [Microbacterium sp. NPDC057407]|uniref:hypothetical protein n=1 Tax=Microbacterium sp. NPDC057407 TaxID=3346120 RepID=UPI00366C4F35